MALKTRLFFAKSDKKSPLNVPMVGGGGMVARLGLSPKFYHFFGGFPNSGKGVRRDLRGQVGQGVKMISLDDTHSENIWFSLSTPLNYHEKLRCHA